MIIKIPTIVKVIFGTDNFEFRAHRVRISWDENSFKIEGLFQPNKIKVDKENIPNAEEKEAADYAVRSGKYKVDDKESCIIVEYKGKTYKIPKERLNG